MKESLFHVIIKSVGEAISGKTVKLVASNDVSLQAATNTSEKLENAKSKGWSVGANISVAGGGILGFDASANAAKQKSNTKVITHTGTTVVGSDAVTITSGKDTHISGSKVIGKFVTADVGGNLSIESLQDTKTYVGESSNKGFSVSTNAGSLSNVSMSSSKGKMKSDYASVTDQAGIYAGDGGFVINTAETTSLTGAVIDSTADTNKNKLSTKLLDVKDVENTAEYTSRNVGMSYNHVGNFKNLSKAGKDAVWNTLGTLPNLLPDSSKSSSSTTKSAISNGTIEVRDANFNMQTLSRDTKDSLNKLDEIFDKKKIEERQELSKLFAKEAFGQLHNWNPTSKEGKAAKAIAHGVVAEVSARMAGNKPGSGFYAGATNEALIGEIQKIAKEKPDVAQTLSALLGAAVNGSLGYSPVTGAAEAQYGTKWNANQVEPNMKRILNDIESTGIYVNSKGEKIYISKLYKDNSTVEYMVITTENEKGERITSVLDKDYNFIDVDITGGTLNLFKSDYDLRKRNKVDITLYDDYITGKDRLNDFSPTKTVLTVKVKEDVGNLKYTPNFYMKKEDRPLEVSSKVIESYMGTTFWGMSAEHYGSSGVQKLFKKMTPGYVRSGTRAIINSGSRAIGGYASGAALLVAAKIDNEMTFKGHPDLIAKANMLDETAYGLGVVTSLGAAGATAGTFGTGAPISYTASVGVNISYGLFVEYQKYKLLKEKEERDKHVGI